MPPSCEENRSLSDCLAVSTRALAEEVQRGLDRSAGRAGPGSLKNAWEGGTMHMKCLSVLVVACMAGLGNAQLATRAQPAQAEKCQGSECLHITAKRTGTRCGSGDSIEVAIQNVSSENLRGYVVFGTPGGKSSYSPTGLMRPGEVQPLGGPQYVCHGSGEVSVLANTGADPKYPPKSPAIPARGEQQVGASEINLEAGGRDPGTPVSGDPDNPWLQKFKVGQGSDSADGVYEIPAPEYDFYTADTAQCPAQVVDGKLTERFALFKETASLQITVRNHKIERYKQDVRTHFAGCLYPEQVRGNPTFHFKTKPAAIGERG
jgi:hypothetical protein